MFSVWVAPSLSRPHELFHKNPPFQGAPSFCHEPRMDVHLGAPCHLLVSAGWQQYLSSPPGIQVAATHHQNWRFKTNTRRDFQKEKTQSPVLFCIELWQKMFNKVHFQNHRWKSIRKSIDCNRNEANQVFGGKEEKFYPRFLPPAGYGRLVEEDPLDGVGHPHHPWRREEGEAEGEDAEDNQGPMILIKLGAKLFHLEIYAFYFCRFLSLIYKISMVYPPWSVVNIWRYVAAM